MNRQGNKIDINTYQPIGTKNIQCIDCGKEVEVDGIVKKQERCKECYKTHRNNYQKELMRKKGRVVSSLILKLKSLQALSKPVKSRVVGIG